MYIFATPLKTHFTICVNEKNIPSLALGTEQICVFINVP